MDSTRVLLVLLLIPTYSLSFRTTCNIKSAISPTYRRFGTSFWPTILGSQMNDGEAMEEESDITSSDLARLDTSRFFADLRQRQTQIKMGGGGEAGAIVQLLTMQSPGDLIAEFMMTSSPMVVDAMRQAITGLLGGLPREVLVDYSTTTDKLKSLATMLQMTGYMFRNGEYVLTLQKLLNIKSIRRPELKAAFDEIDLDGNGYLDRGEVEQLFRNFYNGEAPPYYEVQTFIKFFDLNKDGKISWTEFSKGLGLDAGATMAFDKFDFPSEDPLQLGPTADVEMPGVEGKVTIQAETGQQLEVDASIYLDSLRKEAAALKAAIEVTTAASTNRGTPELAMAGGVDSTSLAEYIKNLSPKHRDALTQGIEPKTLEAMRRLVNWVVGEQEVVGTPDKKGNLSLDRNSLASLCLWQLVLGYKLREAEATGEAKILKGR